MPDDAPTPPFYAVLALTEEQLNYLRQLLAKREWQISSYFEAHHKEMPQEMWHELVVLTQIRDLLHCG